MQKKLIQIVVNNLAMEYLNCWYEEFMRKNDM